PHNHKVIDIKELSTSEDVYNGEVEDTHNYFVMCGENDAILSANCGETPLFSKEYCVLGSINLFKFSSVKDWNWEGLENTVSKSVRFLDNIIDKQAYPLKEFEITHKGNRKIGLGVMGWADSLIKRKIRYDSEEALIEAEKVMEFINKCATESSRKLAEEKGSFPNFDKSIFHIPIRNATVTTIAPTGSLSILASSSSGIEPVYDFITKQKRPVGEHEVIHPLYKKYKEENPNKPLPDYFVTAKEISDKYHISYELLAKVLQKLTREGIIISYQGVKGGYILARKPDQIKLSDVIYAIEGKSNISLMNCEAEKPEMCNIFSTCTIKYPLAKIQDIINNVFNDVTISEIV
ncbi:MAG: Rrf2 family transcriptional regulator, partial [Bacteroidetes bacterium]|nr:Rrf2 family transcriptional regulator [Bacteroidota bacterium]MBU1423938.1 Rrf2 family transcriptional regulator [Bacteroidota bacterium]